MATAINRAPRLDEIKLQTNIPQTFALKYRDGKEVGSWGNVMFTAVDGRRLFLNTEDANEFEHALTDLEYKPAEVIRVTRVKHGKARGGGFSIRVERVDELDRVEPSRAVSSRINPSRDARSAPPQTETETLLERSIELARKTESEQQHVTAAHAKLLAALMTAVDVAVESESYAEKRGFRLSFGEESIRCMGLSIYIGDCKGAR
jgi:hypothetical protein